MLAALAFVALAAHAGENPDGRALYFGDGPPGLEASIAGIARPGFSCAQCHGRDGSGTVEGRWAAPAIDALASADPAYDAETFAQALREGVATGGRALDIAMPRFRASREEADALWEFVSGLRTEERRGVTPQTVRLAIVAAPSDMAAADGLRLEIERAWRIRGSPLIHLRTSLFEVVVMDDGGAPALEDVFAVIAADPGGDPGGGLPARLSRLGIPVLGPARYPARGEAGLADVFWLTAGEDAVREALSDMAGAAIRPVVRQVADTSELRAIAAGDDPVADIAVLLPWSVLQAAPDTVDDLLNRGMDVLALRPGGDIADRVAFSRAMAEILEKSLMDAGRDLTRSRWIAELSRLRATPADWPPLDYAAHPMTGTTELELLRVGKPNPPPFPQ